MQTVHKPFIFIALKLPNTSYIHHALARWIIHISAAGKVQNVNNVLRLRTIYWRNHAPGDAATGHCHSLQHTVQRRMPMTFSDSIHTHDQCRFA